MTTHDAQGARYKTESEPKIPFPLKTTDIVYFCSAFNREIIADTMDDFKGKKVFLEKTEKDFRDIASRRLKSLQDPGVVYDSIQHVKKEVCTILALLRTTGGTAASDIIDTLNEAAIEACKRIKPDNEEPLCVTVPVTPNPSIHGDGLNILSSIKKEIGKKVAYAQGRDIVFVPEGAELVTPYHFNECLKAAILAGAKIIKLAKNAPPEFVKGAEKYVENSVKPMFPLLKKQWKGAIVTADAG